MVGDLDLPAAIDSNQNTVQNNTVDSSNILLDQATPTVRTFDYTQLQERVQSFKTWPKRHHLKPEELADAGFYYKGNKDHVKCFSCNIDLSEWEDGEDAWVEHIKHRPKCEHVLQKKEEHYISAVQLLFRTHSKVTLKMVNDEIENCNSTLPHMPTDHSHETTIFTELLVEMVGDLDLPAAIDSNQNTAPNSKNKHNSRHYHKAGIECKVPNCTTIRDDEPKHPEFKDNFTRLITVINQPSNHCISPISIADAGYFCSHNRYCCFFCGDEILFFSEKDDVYEEHARRAPHCAHIREVKGGEFIHIVQMKDKDAELDSTETYSSDVEQPIKDEELTSGPSGFSLTEQDDIINTLGEGNKNCMENSTHVAQPQQVATVTDTRPVQESSQSDEPSVSSAPASLHASPQSDLIMIQLVEHERQSQNTEYSLSDLICHALRITRRICHTHDNTFEEITIDVNPPELSFQHAEEETNVSNDIPLS